jgi:hypothetical protein
MTTFDLPDPRFAAFCDTVRAAFRQTRVTQAVEGKQLTGFPPGKLHPVWIRDHTYQLRGFRYIEPDVKSAVEVFAQTQAPDGAVFDWFDKEGRGARVPTEADVEFLLVEAVYLAWQSSGDNDWMARLLPALEKAMGYSMTDAKRWAPALQLVKRPFSLDTWDFVYNPRGKFRRNPYGEIDAHTTYGIMHGDNSGMCQAAGRLATLYRQLGDTLRAEHWETTARGFRERTNRVCWNGRFYTHQVHLDPVTVEGVDEASQLSLSNAFNLNRGIADFRQRCSIIEEYRRRKAEAREYFAEWFGIHPPFPAYSFHAEDFSGDWVCNPGCYVNGGVLPLVGGELARGAFENGFEEYGLDILDRYFDLVKAVGPYVWYHPDGRPCPDTAFAPPDVWGLAAMFAALVEGFAGVKDESSRFERVTFSPRLCIVGITKGAVAIGYEGAGAGFSYDYALDLPAKTLALKFHGTRTREVACHILLPKGMSARRVVLRSGPVALENELVRQSPYVNFRAPGADEATIEFGPHAP